MKKRKFSDEDLRELLAYIASNPAFPFPELSDKEREQLVKDALEEMNYLKELYEGDIEKSQRFKEVAPKLYVHIRERNK